VNKYYRPAGRLAIKNRPDANLKSFASLCKKFLQKIVKVWFFDALSNPESAASVCKICARMSRFLLAPLMRSKKSRFWQFTQVNSVGFDRFC